MHRRGFGLVEVLIASVIAGLVAFALVSLFNTLFKGGQFVELKTELESHRQRLLENLSCAKTQAQCTAAGAYVELRNLNDVSLIANGGAAGTRLGAYLFRVRCETPSPALAIEVKLAPEFLANKPQNRPLGEDWRPLFRSGADPCAAGGPPPRVIQCPAGQVMKGFNLDTGVPDCSVPTVALTNCFFWDNGPYDHCGCPSGYVLALWNGDVPIPPGMLFQANCTCCRPVVQIP